MTILQLITAKTDPAIAAPWPNLVGTEDDVRAATRMRDLKVSASLAEFESRPANSLLRHGLRARLYRWRLMTSATWWLAPDTDLTLDWTQGVSNEDESLIPSR